MGWKSLHRAPRLCTEVLKVLYQKSDGDIPSPHTGTAALSWLASLPKAVPEPRTTPAATLPASSFLPAGEAPVSFS